MNGSRRNSGSSLVSSSSASSNLSHLEEDTWILWGRIVNEWEEWRKRKEKLLKVRKVIASLEVDMFLYDFVDMFTFGILASYPIITFLIVYFCIIVMDLGKQGSEKQSSFYVRIKCIT